MIDIRFSGDIGTFQGVTLALVVAAAAWMLYYWQIQHRDRLTAFTLPSLRAVAVFLLVLMLTQPVLHHRQIIGELGRLFVVIDSSRSLNVKDLDNTPAQKILSAHARETLKGNFINTDIEKAIRDLQHSHLRLSYLVNRGSALPVLREAGNGYVEVLGAALDEAKGLNSKVADPNTKGTILNEIWRNVPGWEIAPLVNSPVLKKQPSALRALTSFETPTDFAETYASRIRGYIYPPKDGPYTFWIASDDQAQLYLSTDENPNNKRMIAWVPDWVSPRQWDKHPQQRSQPITLKAGKRYYIEALHKENTGGDHVAVAWQLPGGEKEMPIPGNRLSPIAAQSQTAAELVKVVRAHINTLDKAKDNRNRSEVIPILRQLLDDGTSVARVLKNHVDYDLDKLAASDQPEAVKAIREYDQLTRWNRVQALMFDGDVPLIEELAENHEVELQALKGDKLETLWRSTSGRLAESTDVPAFLASTPNAEITDLSAAFPAEAGDQKTAVLFLTDGQDNHGKSPIALSKVLGQKGIPVYTVGIGASTEPQDLAIRGVTGPETVYIKDHATGTITFNDTMAPSTTFKLRVSFGGKTLWEKHMQTDGSGLRSVDYQFAVEEPVKSFLKHTDTELKYQSVPMKLNIEIDQIEKDRQKKNNYDTHDLLVVTRRRSILLIDQRPRWEWRYLKSMLRRDAKWDVNCVLPKDSNGKMAFKRGKEEGMLPTNRQELFKYDLVILGDVAKDMLKQEELTWLRDFVTTKGGGLILIDGRHQALRQYAGSQIDTLLPVTWEEGPGLRDLSKITLTTAGQAASAFDLSNGKENSEQVWSSLPLLHWTANVKAIPGTETLAQVRSGDATTPLMVYRRCGSGKVFYCGSADTWRWRYRRADKYHRRFWNQVIDWIMERPFTVQDKYVSLDTGPATYAEGQTADIRVRLRDDQGHLLSDSKCDVMLYRDNKLAGILPLTEDKASGTYRARTGKLRPGNYRITVRAADISPDKIKAESTFEVREPVSRELAKLACNRKLLEEVAMHSNGAYFPEEQIRDVIEVLKPLSSGRVVETDTALWQSYWYFILVVLLLTIDWTWRKKKGMI